MSFGRYSSAAILIFLATLACAPSQVCSLVGCTSSLTIQAAWIGQPPSFDVSVEATGFSGTFTCTLQQDGTGYGREPSAISGDFDEGRVAPECGPVADFALHSRSPAQLPTELTVSVVTVLETRTQEFSEIEYALRRPNGDECEPECGTAAVAFD